MNVVIRTENLSKAYQKGCYALEKLNLEVPQGGVCGLLGPNGAGKTTTVKLLNGLLLPTEGACSVMGLNPVKEPEKIHAVSGVMTETAKMYSYLTGMENLVFFGEMAGLNADDASQRGAELLHRLNLWEARDKKVQEYSTGMKQRLSLARTLMHRPQVLFLDEPTSGLDPESAQDVNELIKSLAQNDGITVLLCTHQLRYAQDICTSYGIINSGRLLASGTFEELWHQIGCSILAGFRIRKGDRLDKRFSFEDGLWKIPVSGEEDMPVLLRELLDGGHDVFESEIIYPTLEDVYFDYLSKEEMQNDPV